MRLDAARLKGCFGSCFRQKLLPEVKVFCKGFEEPASRQVFSFLAVHSTAPWIQDLAP